MSRGAPGPRANGEQVSSAWEIAISHALLLRVARGEVEPALRLYQPAPTVAFGRLDRALPGFPRALEAARARGFEPLLRLAGGRAAAYHSGSLVFESILADGDGPRQIERGYEAVSTLLRSALASLGAPIAIGPLDGEYCAGRFSLNLGGRVKVAGIAQRSVRGASLVSAAIIVDNAAPVREVLTDVYRALALDFDPATAGALADAVPGLGCEDLFAALTARLGDRRLGRARLEPATLRLASELLPKHQI